MRLNFYQINYRSLSRVINKPMNLDTRATITASNMNQAVQAICLAEIPIGGSYLASLNYLIINALLIFMSTMATNSALNFL